MTRFYFYDIIWLLKELGEQLGVQVAPVLFAYTLKELEVKVDAEEPIVPQVGKRGIYGPICP